MKMMADAGVTASVTPEDEAGMGHGWPPIGRLIAAGVRTNVGIVAVDGSVTPTRSRRLERAGTAASSGPSVAVLD